MIVTYLVLGLKLLLKIMLIHRLLKRLLTIIAEPGPINAHSLILMCVVCIRELRRPSIKLALALCLCQLIFGLPIVPPFVVSIGHSVEVDSTRGDPQYFGGLSH